MTTPTPATAADLARAVDLLAEARSILAQDAILETGSLPMMGDYPGFGPRAMVATTNALVLVQAALDAIAEGVSDDD